MKQPIVIHSEDDYERAQQRVRELEAAPPSANKERELQALADAMLAYELRREAAED